MHHCVSQLLLKLIKEVRERNLQKIITRSPHTWNALYCPITTYSPQSIPESRP